MLVVNHTTNGNQFTMSNRHQELASPKQTTLGKDKSNPFMVDSLPKTIWLSMHHVLAIKHWLVQSKWLLVKTTLASPKQTAIGKDFPNPFMAGSLPKTIKQSNDPPLSRDYILGSGEDSLKLMGLMANCTKLSAFVRKKNREI
ncbi:hypothetical protein Tco_0118315 [Tanacetum coccineum]